MATILGIDPGTHRLGWGVISGNPSKSSLIASGCYESKAGTSADIYLPGIAAELTKIIAAYHPDCLGLETLLFQKNITTAISVAEARGVIRLQAALHHLPLLEVAPNTVKLAVAGVGSAGKQEVTRMVGLLLGCDTAELLDDTTDALAIALTAQTLFKSTRTYNQQPRT